MMVKNNLAKFILLISISFFMVLINNTKNVSALNGSYSDPIIQKASLTAAIACYDAGRLKSTAGKLSDVTGPDKLFNTSSNSSTMALDVFMPSGVSGLKRNQISCEGIFLGTSMMTDIFNTYWDKDIYGSYSGIFEGAGKSDYVDGITDPEERVKFLTDMGYRQQGAIKQCAYYSFRNPNAKNKNNEYIYTDNVCYRNNDLYVESSGGAGGTTVKFSPHDGYFLDAEVNGNTYQNIASTLRGWDNFKRDLETFISNTVVRDVDNSLMYVGEIDNTHGDAWYTLPPSMPSGDLRVSPSDILASFSTNGYSDLADLQFTDSEKLTYLIEALKNWIYKDKAIDEYQRCDISDFAANTKYKKINYNLTNGSASDTCGIDSTSTSNDYIYWLNSADLFDISGEAKLYLDDIVFEINKLIDAGVVPSTITSSGEDKCLSSGAAENLGWIICPILNFASEQAQNLYSDLIEPALQIKPNLFRENNAQGGSTYQAWTIFQGFANTIFIIFFLFVIFSQVTGVGIDNYGIKKIMPKLIVTAILVNLSYIICQVCVDLSNIIGNGVQSIFNELSSKVTISAALNGVDIGAQIGSTMISAVGIAAAAYVAYITWAVWLLPLIVAVIGAIISIIFLFILLAGRQAIIVLLTVISPLAFVCYLLPNTKKLFDRYVKIGEVMLLLYPICGLVVAGGSYVSKLLLSIPSGELDLFYTFTAIVISIAPIFFIPKLVKSSFSALGSVGATLSGLGARLSGRAKSGISKSGAYKAGQERLAEAQTKWRAGIGADGKPIDMTLGQRLMRGSFSNRNIARNRVQALKDQDVRDRADRLSSGIGFEAAQIAQQKAAEADQVKDYMTYINSKTNNGENKGALNDLFDDYTKEGQENKFGAIAIARIAGRRKDTANAFLDDHFNKNANYSEQIRNSLAKEIATGDNSGNYRASSPLGFEYASQINSGMTSASSYSAWLGNKNNIHDALDHHVTSSKELVGLKGSSLEEIRDLAVSGQMGESDIQRISDLAKLAKDNKDKYSEYDTTKEAVIDDLIKLRNPASSQAGVVETTAPAEGAPQEQSTDQPATGGNRSTANGGGGAQQGQVFDVRAMSTETLEDMATNPNVPMNDPTRTAAELELHRRTNPNNHRETFEGGSGI